MKHLSFLAAIIVLFAGGASAQSVSTPPTALVGPVSLDYTVCASGCDFVDVPTGIDAVKQRLLPNSGTQVNFTVQKGHYTYTRAIRTDGKIGSSVFVIGQNAYTASLLSVQSSSGSAGAWTYVLNLTDVSRFSVGDWVGIPSAVTGGSNGWALAGAHQVTVVDGVNNRITVTSKSQATVAASGAVTGTLNVFDTVITFSGSDGVLPWSGGSAIVVKDLMLVGDRSAHSGFSPQDVSRSYMTGNAVGVANFNDGVLLLYNSELNGDAAHVYLSDNAQDGIDAGNNTTINLPNVESTGNVRYGYNLTTSNALIGTGSAIGNGSHGHYAQFLGFGSFNGQTTAGNVGYGYATGELGGFSRQSNTYASNTAGNFLDPFKETTSDMFSNGGFYVGLNKALGFSGYQDFNVYIYAPDVNTMTFRAGGNYVASFDSKYHLLWKGPAPTLSSCGTSPAVSGAASDQAGTITTGGAATTCTATFANAYAIAPTCVVVDSTGVVPAYSVSTTAITVSSTAAGRTLFYTCVTHS